MLRFAPLQTDNRLSVVAGAPLRFMAPVPPCDTPSPTPSQHFLVKHNGDLAAFAAGHQGVGLGHLSSVKRWVISSAGWMPQRTMRSTNSSMRQILVTQEP